MNVKIIITKECKLSISQMEEDMLEVALFVNDRIYGEPIFGITWQAIIELMLQISRGELSEFMIPDLYDEEKVILN